jgi:hypothetical protein
VQKNSKFAETFVAAFNLIFTTRMLMRIIILLSVLVVMEAIKGFG